MNTRFFAPPPLRATALLALWCAAALEPASWRGEPARPGYRFQFPRDHFGHPSYQTEWWYYTGNLSAADGHRFGFEMTFFRFHPAEEQIAAERGVWDATEVYIAHFAVSDVTGKKFYHEERLNRAGPGLAGIDEAEGRIWNGNWSARFLSFQPVTQRLEAVTDHAHLVLSLQSEKPPAIHGNDGVSRKGPREGQASHYYSLTRNRVSGRLSVGGAMYDVTGQAWMDREFFTAAPDDDTAGWDWICAQLSNGEDLMIYRLRLKDGSISPFSSGTLIDQTGKATFLPHDAFVFEPGATWHSKEREANYPVKWTVRVPDHKLDLRVDTDLPSQELKNRITRSYWEGTVNFKGTGNGEKIRGVGYLEMTGYTPTEQSKGLPGGVER